MDGETAVGVDVILVGMAGVLQSVKVNCHPSQCSNASFYLIIHLF